MAKSAKTLQQKTNVLIVDDHPIVRQGIKGLLQQEKDLVVCGEADSAGEALTCLSALRPDVVILDISLNGSDGLELTKAIRARDAMLPILIMSMHDEALYAERALRAGANGYIMKKEVASNLVQAVRRVLSGDIYVSENARQRILHNVTGAAAVAESPLNRLSDRELEVFRLIGHGRGTQQIASELHLSVKTIETYRAHIKEKLDLKTATELVRYAVQFTEG
ncbi:MAG: response regulator transcription factor [bacterium]